MSYEQFFSDIKYNIASKEQLEIAKTLGKVSTYVEGNIEISVAVYKGLVYILDFKIIKEGENMSNLEYAVQVVTSDDGCDGKICVNKDTQKEFWTDSYAEIEDYIQYVSTRHNATYKIVSREKKVTVEPVSEHRHPHADMIIEWAKDTSKVVEYYADEMSLHPVAGWKVTDNPAWVRSMKYRFKPAKPERVFPATSLTEDELSYIYWAAPTASSKAAYKYIANAAIKQYILDREKADDK